VRLSGEIAPIVHHGVSGLTFLAVELAIENGLEYANLERNQLEQLHAFLHWAIVGTIIGFTVSCLVQLLLVHAGAVLDLYRALRRKYDRRTDPPSH